MARRPANVTDLLEQVWAPACARAATEREALEALALSRDAPSRIEAWDWRYYAEKVRKVRYDFDEAQVKPYFPLDRMTAAAFDCAARLFGLKFVEQPQVKAYHPDVKVYEVRGADGALVGVFLHDNFARPAKRSGAWMGSYRDQSRIGGAGSEAVVPIVVNNNNFAKAALGEPTLLSFDDARTLFHEFGHGLHGLLSSVTYERVSGTNVLQDFVELPSQIFEHWLSEPEVLKRHARHYATHEPIPDALVERLHAARFFNQGYDTVRYAASALVDMAAHALDTVGADFDIVAFEREELARIGLPDGHRHEPPPAAFPAPVRRLRTTRPATTCTCGPKCSTPTATRRSPRPATRSIRRSRRACAASSTRPAIRSSRRPRTGRSAAARRRSSRCCASAACSKSRPERRCGAGQASATSRTSLPKFSPLKSFSSASGKVLEAANDVLAALHPPVLQVARHLGDRDRIARRVVEHHHAFHARAVDQQRQVVGRAP
jgi:hypothetical protein